MKNLIVFFILFLILILFLSSSSHAFYGARPMGMGGAFTAVADDNNAPYWNPAGLALNPSVNLAISGLIDNRNEGIGDNYGSLKMGYEVEMGSPFEWIFGVGAVSLLALEVVKNLSDRDVLKTGWGREGEKFKKEESMAEEVKRQEEEKRRREKIEVKEEKEEEKQESQPPPPPPPPPPKEIVRERVIIHEHHRYPPPPWWYRPNYRRPTYWEDRARLEDEFQPKHKAQFSGGITWLSDKNASLDQNTDWYTLTLATAWEERVALGGNLNIFDLKIPSINARGMGAGIDLGLLVKPAEKISLGLVAQEILTSDISWSNGAVTRYEMLINAGVALRPFKEMTFAFDVHNLFEQNKQTKTFHYGLEVRPLPGLALRGGLFNNNKTAGASIGVESLIVDYAILGGEFARTQTLSVTWRF